MLTAAQLIDIKFLRTFIYVARHKSVTAAAQSLFMTQPAVSQHIKKIEERIGTSVFNRMDGFELTHEGEILLKYATGGVELYEKMYQELNSHQTKQSFKIAVSNLFCNDLVDEVLSKLRSNHDVDLCLSHYNPSGFNTLQTFDEYDIVLSVNVIPAGPGRLIKLKPSNYKIVSKTKNSTLEKSKPKNVIYINSLSKHSVVNLLSSHKVDTEHVENWLSTSSTDILKNEMNSDDTVIICPDCHRYFDPSCTVQVTTTSPVIELYAWCNEKSVQDIQRYGLFKEANCI